MSFRIACLLLICLLSITPSLVRPQANSGEIDANFWIRKAKEWRMAVAKHTAGERDAAAVAIGNWSFGDQGAVLTSIGAILGKESTKKLQYNRSVYYDSGNITIPRHPVPIISFDISGPFGATLAPYLELGHNPNQVLKLGALLHTDIAVLGLETNGGDSLVQSADGLSTSSVGGWHWQYARLLLHWVSPDPARDGMILQWYIATTAYMFSQRHWGFVELNLQLAQKYYPTDPIILFYSGVLHEIRAAAKSQNALYPYPRSFYFDSKEEELKLALKFFQQAVQADRRFWEAHLHLGRVMGLLGKHENASAELRIIARRLFGAFS
jgi:hypothetical protein